jgi:hypothetical protein
MINDVTFFLELISDVLVSIAVKLLMENGFSVLQNHSIIDQLPFPIDGHLSGFNATNTFSLLVVKNCFSDTRKIYIKSLLSDHKIFLNCSNSSTNAAREIDFF